MAQVRRMAYSSPATMSKIFPYPDMRSTPPKEYDLLIQMEEGFNRNTTTTTARILGTTKIAIQDDTYSHNKRHKSTILVDALEFSFDDVFE
jgi:hypothetical protein